MVIAASDTRTSGLSSRVALDFPKDFRVKRARKRWASGVLPEELSSVDRRLDSVVEVIAGNAWGIVREIVEKGKEERNWIY